MCNNPLFDKKNNFMDIVQEHFPHTCCDPVHFLPAVFLKTTGTAHCGPDWPVGVNR